MNLYNEELRALRTAIERLNWMIKQPQYEDIAYLLVANKEEYIRELNNMLEEDY